MLGPGANVVLQRVILIKNHNTCKICSADTTTVEDKKFELNYYYCGQCRYISVEEKAIISAEEEEALYRQHNNTLENEGYVKMFEKFIRTAIEPYGGELRQALDFGCGPGPVLATLLEQRGFEVDIYDPYFAPQRVYAGKSYGLITATEVFEHLKDPLKTAALLRDHLHKEGILALMTLFHPGEEEQFLKWWYRHDPTHISFYRPETLEVLAHKLGLKVLTFDSKNICVLAKQ